MSKTVQYNFKEAHDHSFYYPGAQNWGWAQFARRDAVYYQPSYARQQDAFIVICSITAAPALPAPVPAIPRHPVPKDLLDTVGSLLDDPVYSDIEFVLPQAGAEPRKIYAARRLLRRVEYFDDMFSSGFAEGVSDTVDGSNVGELDDASVSDVAAYARQFDDSDFEDETDSVMLDTDSPSALPEPQEPMHLDDGVLVSAEDFSASKRRVVSEEEPSEGDNEHGTDDGDEQQTQRNTRPKLSHPSSPRSRDMTLDQPEVPPAPSPLKQTMSARPEPAAPDDVIPGPKKARVVVRDVAYATYLAVLYYIYTDMIVFAPLSSTFLTSPPSQAAQSSTSVVSTPAALPSDSQQSFGASGRANQQQPSETAASSSSSLAGHRTRKEWIAEWARNNPWRPRPPSAKSVYRLADRLGLHELKNRAFQHIIKSLTVENVANEAFSAFSAAFEDVRKVEIAFMFEHWLDVRKGALMNIGQQLRLGKLPGFEEVWPLIIQNLVADERRGEGEMRG
ncbi:hypothetical protein BD413DRAFT_551227 [Trametes elegans]|nr:hypothetical protein BD413DRAFT_551227 [Trametes elegans]